MSESSREATVGRSLGVGSSVSRYLTVSVLYSKHLACVLPNDQACNKQIPDLRNNVNILSSETSHQYMYQ